MKKINLSLIALLLAIVAMAQKKPLDHSVYDGWQSIGEKVISNDGNFVAYTITPQEGDAILYIQKTTGEKIAEIERGYNVKISEDNKYVICKIKPTYIQTRTARIAKKSAADMPKDSLVIIEIATATVQKIAHVKNYKLPEKNSNVLFYLLEKANNDSALKRSNVDSVRHTANTTSAATRRPNGSARGGGNVMAGSIDEIGTDLVMIDLVNQHKKIFHFITDYTLSKNGKVALLKASKHPADSLSVASLIKFNIQNEKTDTILKKFNDAKNFVFDEDAIQLAFVAERDSSAKALQKFYKLYYYKNGTDSAIAIADKQTSGIPAKWSVSEFGNMLFSKSGKRLFFGTAPILPPKDTLTPDFERVNVDVWNYKDDDLMTAQLYNLEREIRKNYLARYDFDSKHVVQLGNEKLQFVQTTLQGDGDVFYASSDYGKRIEKQWQGFALTDWYAINAVTGQSALITQNLEGRGFASCTGKYLLWYDEKKKTYFSYNSTTKKTTIVAKDIPYALYDEENDVPDEPNPYGIVKWMKDDKYVLIYDKYDVWKVDPDAKEKSIVITNGRKNKTEYRYINVDAEEKFVEPESVVYFKTYNEKDKSNGITSFSFKENKAAILFNEKVSIGNSFIKAKNTNSFAYTKETFEQSPNLYANTAGVQTKLSNTNLQQSNYLWGTAELFKWKAYTGKETEGILYKPENFDAKKKYPMIVYFYERNNNTLFNYVAPSPTPSRLNISFFVSRGYLVFVPDIWYTRGHPGKSAYDYIVSGTRALINKGFVDSTKIGLQGQSWGGYQTAILITQTKLYAAAWAGAPVVNMFSAYGGIRWESGLNRQFQYEHTQSRIGATPWERRDLYIENSPLFHLQNVKTPLVIMSNDADGAVPWYQGIEFFTAMRRLNKPVWLLNYNGEAHNLVERKNRKDIQIREQQFFDWLLKGEKPADWLIKGVPAIMKGRDWGLKIAD
ncbi:MAG: S9 family peptidase [Bacteroidetes bacterium]|nr:S9 family peptidase [Bacteroidota bacterium]MBS1650255.1 S9 family peptidase [Bacteroidota bacterium]